MFRRRQVLTHTYADANTEDEALLAFALDDAREDEPERRASRETRRECRAPPFVVGERSALGDARSHEDAARALEGLHTIAHQSRTHAMAVLASLGRWNEASERFLRRPPRSPGTLDCGADGGRARDVSAFLRARRSRRASEWVDENAHTDRARCHRPARERGRAHGRRRGDGAVEDPPGASTSHRRPRRAR